jgi:CheY-like chemotaxis protein
MEEKIFDAETILVVDDDPGVLEFIVEVLRREGYHVLQAAHGNDALDVAAAFAAPIHLIVSDVNMPQMSGWKLLERLRAWYPTIRFLMVSGYAQPQSSIADLAGTATSFLPKPFTPDDLLIAARELLDRNTKRRSPTT